MDKFIDFFVLTKARLKRKIKNHIEKEKAFLKKLIFPLKLFPIKLIFYLFYYLIKTSWAIFVWLIKSFFRAIIWPFRKWSNFFKTILWFIFIIYIFFSLLVIADYLTTNYGHYSKFLCNVGLKEELENKVVRIIGDYGEGSGFFKAPKQVVTAFHVIEGESSPKIIMPDGKILVPQKIEGNKEGDIAILHTSESYPDKVLEFLYPTKLYRDETLLATGYPMGSELKGRPTILEGKLLNFKNIAGKPASYLLTNINLAKGMSGGPLVERCGKVVGISNFGVGGISFFLTTNSIEALSATFSDQDVAKIKIDTQTPQGVVEAFYTYIKLRDLEKAFNLISTQRKASISSFEDWQEGYKNTIQTFLISAKADEKDKNKILIKLESQDWIGDEIVQRYFEGYWIVVEEEDGLKLNESKIKEVNPTWEWFYSK